jgi:Conserved in the green lineage and diatoms 27
MKLRFNFVIGIHVPKVGSRRSCRYDGQTFVKPPEVLTRDRLLGLYEVKPILQRLKLTLLGAGTTLMATAAALAVLISASADSDGVYGVS